MTREEAEARAASLNREAGPEIRWLASRDDAGGWDVVRLRAPGLGPSHASGAHTESRPKPTEPPDPRPTIFRNIPPYGPG